MRGTAADPHSSCDMMHRFGDLNSSETIRIGRDVWSQAGDHSDGATAQQFDITEDDMTKAVKAAQSSRRLERSFADTAAADIKKDREAAIATRKQATKEDVTDWLNATLTLKAYSLLLTALKLTNISCK